MESGLFLDVVVGQGAAILQLFAGKDETLLIWGNSLFVLDLSLHVLNGIRWLHFKSDGLASQGLDEDLHASSQTQHQMESGLFLDVVVGQGAAILQLFAGKDETLLIWGNSLFVLDLSLHVLNGIRWLHFKSDGLASQGLDEDLHASSKPEHQMEGGFFLDVVVRQGSAILKLFTSKDKPLLIWGDSLFVLNLGLHILDGVRWLHFQCDCLACESLHENLHSSPQSQHKVKCRLLLNVVI